MSPKLRQIRLLFTNGLISLQRKKAILGRMDQRLISLGKTLESLPPVSNIDVIEGAVEDAKSAAVRDRSKDDAFFDDIVEQTDRLVSRGPKSAPIVEADTM